MQVKVRNINVHEFSEKYQGKMVTIPAGGYVEMDEEDAVMFKSQFHPFKVDNKGQHDPRHFKMLTIERDPGHVGKDVYTNKFVCQACKEQTSSWTELEAHMRLMHSDQLVRDADYEKYQAQKAKENGAKAAAGAGGARP